jgi:DNA invertase Pin-like site-specific DNA recombinase
MKYLIYTRVSPRGSRWSGETSCETQADNCRRYVMARDPKAVFLYEKDELITGTTNDRPALNRILAEIGKGEWDTLVVLDMERLVRGIRGWISLSDVLLAHHKGLIVCSLDLDYSSLQGQTMLQVSAVLGGFFAKQNALKTRQKMEHMARKGLWCPGETPMGYIRPVRPNPNVRMPDDNILVIEPKGAAVVTEIFERYIAGESTNKLARRLNIPEDRILRILKNRVYTGKIIYGEITSDGKHEPIITPEQFALVAARLPGTSTGPRRQAHIYEYLLSGHVHCSCGKMMSASHSKGGSGKSYPYYRCGDVRCKAPRKMIRADQLDRAVLEQIAARAENDHDVEANYERIMKSVSNLRKQSDDVLDELRGAVAPLEKRAENLSQAIQAGTMGPKTIQSLSDDLEGLYGQIEVFRGQIEAQERALEASTPPDTVQILAAAWRQMARSLIESADTDRRRKWVEMHVDKIFHLRGDDWKIQFMAYAGDPARVRTSGGGWYPARWLCELFLTISKRAA